MGVPLLVLSPTTRDACHEKNAGIGFAAVVVLSPTTPGCLSRRMPE